VTQRSAFAVVGVRIPTATKVRATAEESKFREKAVISLLTPATVRAQDFTIAHP
jgi:hypothetical protein